MDDDEIQQRILDAAQDCVLDSGPTARLHHLIAERAGISRPTVYKHVGDQKAIIEALLHRELGRFLTAVQPVATRRGSLRERFIDTVVFSVTYAQGHPLLQKLLRDEPGVALPWFSTRAAPAFERVMASFSSYTTEPQGGGRAISPKVIVEWQSRLVASLITTPSIVADVSDPLKLRRYVSDLLDIGLPAPAP